ncbi:uncharacterized protein LOC103316414 [Nasonia vitripennis]|uniref:Uncharacterized protein n=2 Tax=Nasonia vitripennis TaxID=7425 RepID=A0A7M7T9S8_NASVI|nr:uncharacterized protein LOC103316414 [Nasonia vitripennis]
MEFAWVRFHKSKVETCLKVSDISSKVMLPNGVPQIVPFRPKDEKDFVSAKWYFAQANPENHKNGNPILSRLVILYLGVTQDDIDLKRKADGDGRKRFATPKCMNSQSSFEDPSQCSQNTSQSKKINNERAKNVLKRIDNYFEVPPFRDLEENNVTANSGTSSVMKSAVVVLEKLASENNMITDQPSSPESPSLLATRKRKMSKPGDVNSKPPQASGSYVKVPQSKKPTISPSSSESETESYDSLRLDLFYKYKQPQESSNNPDGQLSPIQSFSPESQKSTPRRNTPSPNLSENISPEHTPPPGRPLFTPSPSRSQVIQPQDAPGERQPPVRNEVRDSRDAPGDVPQPPIRNEIDGEPQDAADQEQLPIQNEDIIEVQDPVNREQPQNGHQSPPQNEPRPRRIKYYKMTEYVKNCVEYYAKRGEPGNREMRRRYNIAFGNELYLGEDISVNLLQWELLQRHKPQVFLIELAVLIWGERNLCNRALDLTRGVENIPNRSPVKLIEKDILRLLISLYNDFLNNHKYPSDEKASYLLRATHVLRHKIRDLRAAEKNKFQLPNVNAQRRLRYNVRD